MCDIGDQQILHSTHRMRPKGYSLIEMMVVLALVAITLAAGLPNFLGYMNRGRVETAANDLEAYYKMARQKAVTERSVHRVRFDSVNGTYRIERRNSAGTWVGAPDETISLPSGVSMVLNLGGEGGNNDLVIDPRGLIDFDDVPARITLRGANDTLSVSIVRTGRVRTARGH